MQSAIRSVRRFNRFYTRVLGLLDEGHLDSEYSLAEVRLLFELAHRHSPTAASLAQDLGLDAGYLSRTLRSMARRHLLEKTRSPTDLRSQTLALTATGLATVNELEERASADIARLLAPLKPSSRAELVDALKTVESLLSGPQSSSTPAPSVILRTHRPGDMGWVVQSHALLYFREYAWDEQFEALVATICADFLRTFDARRERCWIAEQDGVNVGSVFIVKHPERAGVAKLRLLLVEPSARGHGLGRTLVQECTRFARHAGYHTIALWTNDVLVAARRIYETEGYRLVAEDAHHSFGYDLTGQTWELALSPLAEKVATQ